MTELTVTDLRLLGGKATLKKYGKDHYKKMAQKSAISRKKKKLLSSKSS